MRLIDADELKRSLQRAPLDPLRLSIAETFINKAETVDAVPVVRCKDCRKYDHGCCIAIRYKGDDSIIAMKPDDFCSYGEKREEKQ